MQTLNYGVATNPLRYAYNARSYDSLSALTNKGELPKNIWVKIRSSETIDNTFYLKMDIDIVTLSECLRQRGADTTLDTSFFDVDALALCRKVYAMEAANNPRLAVREIFTYVEKNYAVKRFQAINRLLELIDYDRMSDLCIIGLMRVTTCAAEHLLVRQSALNKARMSLEKKQSSAIHLLYGRGKQEHSGHAV